MFASQYGATFYEGVCYAHFSTLPTSLITYNIICILFLVLQLTLFLPSPVGVNILGKIKIAYNYHPV